MTEHLNVRDSLAAGLSAPPGMGQAFASTQAAWRCYQNERVSYEQSAAPLPERARQSLAEASGRYALIAQDWPHPDYTERQRTSDRARLHNQQASGYE